MIKRWIILALLLFAGTCNAQVQLQPNVKNQYFDNNGRVLSGGCIFSYISGTNTPQATYSDFTGTVPNPNPIVLDASGRPPSGTDIWLTGSVAYRLQLVSRGGTNCISGVQIWIEDGINPSASSLLASNNTWTGTNDFTNSTTFDGGVQFNVGFTSVGPNFLSGGGNLSGTWAGSPTFSGTPNFANSFTANGGVFSGQITSTVPGGTAPFVVASNTEVLNLNSNLLEGCDWASPCAIGTSVPNTAVFTTMNAQTSATINGVTISGTPTPGQVMTAVSSSVGNWQNPPAIAVQASSTTILISDVPMSASSTTPIITKSVTMPSSGCPCRALVSYSLFFKFNSGTNNMVTWINDGTSNYATATRADASNISDQGISSSAMSPTTYANGASVTFVLNANGTSAASLTAQASNGAGVAQNSWLNVNIMPSL